MRKRVKKYLHAQQHREGQRRQPCAELHHDVRWGGREGGELGNEGDDQLAQEDGRPPPIKARLVAVEQKLKGPRWEFSAPALDAREMKERCKRPAERRQIL